MDLSGIVTWHGPISATVTAITAPSLSLSPCRPNPAIGRAIIHYAVPSTVPVTLKVYDILGREVRTLVDGIQPAGWHSASWNGDDDGQRPCASGVYFYRLVAPGATLVRKITLIK
jgi:hypothetical protein